MRPRATSSRIVSGAVSSRSATRFISGVIDSDYRGEVCVILVNLGQEEVALARGERIAQLVVAPVSRAELAEVAELPATGRGAGGFGHTGR